MQIPQTYFHVEKLHYYPVKAQQPMRMRPYEFSANGEAIDIVAQRVGEARMGRIDPSMLTGVTGSLVQPSAVGYEGAVNHSWVNTPRYVFMMKVNYVDHGGNQISSYLIGYTDHDGMSLQGSVNPELMHYVNNIIETTNYMTQTPMGYFPVEKLSNVYNTIYRPQNSQAELHTQRPTDMFDVMNSMNVASFMQEGITGATVSNLITPFTNNTISSSNSNSITTNYLTNILNAGIQSAKNLETFVPSVTMGNPYNSSVGEHGQSLFNEPSITDNQFIGAISAVVGSRVKIPYFSFRAIEALDPLVDAPGASRVDLFNTYKDEQFAYAMPSPETGDHWNGQDPVTVKAFSFIENSVALATKYGFTKLLFIASNMSDVTGAVQVNAVNWKNFLTIAEQDVVYLVEIFKTKFISEIFLSETSAGRIPVYMECHVDLLGTSKVYLQYDQWPANWYTAPTYANSLYSSVVTSNQSTMQHSAEQINSVVNTLGHALSPMNRIYTPSVY